MPLYAQRHAYSREHVTRDTFRALARRVNLIVRHEPPECAPDVRPYDLFVVDLASEKQRVCVGTLWLDPTGALGWINIVDAIDSKLWPPEPGDTPETPPYGESFMTTYASDDGSEIIECNEAPFARELARLAFEGHETVVVDGCDMLCRSVEATDGFWWTVGQLDPRLLDLHRYLDSVFRKAANSQRLTQSRQ